MNNIETRTFEPQIREVKLGQQEFRLAFPECTVAFDEDAQSLKPLFRLRGNLYVSPPRPIGYDRPPNNQGDPFDCFWKSPFPELSGLPRYCLEYCNSWAEITERNPDAILKHFDPEGYRKSCKCAETFYLNPRHDHFQRVNSNLVDDQRAQWFEIKTHTPKLRSIQFLSDGAVRKFIPIYFPELTFISAQPINSLLCLAKTGENSYIPFLLPNVWLTGNVCLGIEFIGRDLANAFHYFWNSTFTELISSPFRVNKNLTIHSTEQWESLAHHDPEFLRKFDPIFSEQYSPIIYKIENNSLSWEFK